MRRLLLIAAVWGLVGAVSVSTVSAEEWPSLPISLVLPFAAGSGLEVTARIVGERLGAALGQPILIDPRPGANGVLAATYVARAAHDGYTIFMTTNTTHSAAKALVKNLSYDPIKDFTPIARIGNLPFMMVVNPKIPVKTVAEFIAYAKAHPGQINYASTNATGLVGAATIARIAGVEMTNVPYKSGPQGLMDVISGDVSMMLVDIASGLPQWRSGAVRALMVTTAEHSPLLPDLPGTREAGLPSFDVNSWNGVFGPAGMPEPIATRLHDELRHIVEDPSVRAQLAKFGFDAFSGSRQDFADFVRDEQVKWTKWIGDAGIQAE